MVTEAERGLTARTTATQNTAGRNRNVVEVINAKTGELVVMSITTQTRTASGMSMNTKETRQADGQLVMSYRKIVTKDVNGGTTSTEESLNSKGELVLTRKVSTR